MREPRRQSCRVEYQGERIVISGSSTEIHREAARIIRRFASSATPYRLVSDTANQVVLERPGS
ncbi:hypothetical protein [Nitrococcus mobilis]|uniref:Uncharacterized protein n=1 Tax=Nitrococcus mobilis Nb-231 TaxID=314278 RepID=A4BNR1_9GAMM|nr:hypothetical protein [Nitrococcus mobilis]EAR22860.1 hypothetical protein NB231_10418 [Nitrococcus mobilis Nb-231]